jgi:dipeptidyl aminopeptidase/acylaminoacyl peptidase
LRYSGGRSQIQTADLSITKISFNNQLPQGLFEPQERLAIGFSEDASGLKFKLLNQLAPTENSPPHQPFAAGLAPNGFNPALAQLYFRYPESFDTEAVSALVDVLAGGYTLGRAQFGNPWTAICARSPNGQKIAYVSQPADAQSTDAALHWFDLQNVNLDHLVSEDLAVDNFAFSYDGQKLAFFGRQAGQARGAVYISDLQSGALQRLLDRNSANSLVWSPDGNFLAMTSDPTMLGSQNALVVDVHDGIIVAHDRYNWRGDFFLDPLAPDWPTFTWRSPRGAPVKFPVAMGGLEACVQPPD